MFLLLLARCQAAVTHKGFRTANDAFRTPAASRVDDMPLDRQRSHKGIIVRNGADGFGRRRERKRNLLHEVRIRFSNVYFHISINLHTL